MQWGILSEQCKDATALLLLYVFSIRSMTSQHDTEYCCEALSVTWTVCLRALVRKREVRIGGQVNLCNVHHALLSPLRWLIFHSIAAGKGPDLIISGQDSLSKAMSRTKKAMPPYLVSCQMTGMAHESVLFSPNTDTHSGAERLLGVSKVSVATVTVLTRGTTVISSFTPTLEKIRSCCQANRNESH